MSFHSNVNGVGYNAQHSIIHQRPEHRGVLRKRKGIPMLNLASGTSHSPLRVALLGLNLEQLLSLVQGVSSQWSDLERDANGPLCVMKQLVQPDDDTLILSVGGRVSGQYSCEDE